MTAVQGGGEKHTMEQHRRKQVMGVGRRMLPNCFLLPVQHEMSSVAPPHSVVAADPLTMG